jgi:ATP-dependent Clp protease ATP-binding subunit ClpB
MNNSYLGTEDYGNTTEDNIIDSNVLNIYGTNITEIARSGKLNETFGRQKELEKMLVILARRQKNNPVLIGEAGVGKTAIVELFAIQLVKNLVPFIFKNKSIISLNITKLEAGSRFSGEFEERITNFFNAIFESTNIILFIDEIHTIVSSNNSSRDVAKILKPLLARSGLQCIGASTPKEYMVISNDAALNRRFQPINVEEPTILETIQILQNIRSSLETYHNVEFDPAALKAAAELSSRYIHDRFLPDKAIDLLDIAASRTVVKFTDRKLCLDFGALMNHHLIVLSRSKAEAFRKGDNITQFVLQEIQNVCRHIVAEFTVNPTTFRHLYGSNIKRIEGIRSELEQTQVAILDYIDKVLFLSYERKNLEITENLQEICSNLNPILKENLTKIVIDTTEIDLKFLEFKILNGLLINPKIGIRWDLSGLNLLGFVNNIKNNPDDLDMHHNNSYALSPNSRVGALIEGKDIEDIITEITGVPIQSVENIDIDNLLNLEIDFKRKIIGQEDAIQAIVNAIRRSRLGIQNPNRPIASFLFCGPTGVGKTEITKVLSDIMFGSEKNMIRFDMSEFMEKFGVSRLIGSPPGYIGYEEGGQLTNAIRRKPYSVVLFDEIEKAHPDILTILLQILEDGRLTDGQKKLVKFNNTIIILTSNVGAQEIQKILKDNQNIQDKKNKPTDNLLISKTSMKKNIFPDVIGLTQKLFGISATKPNSDQSIKIKTIKQSRENSEIVKSLLKTTVLNILQNKFLPEFLNRLDDIIIFQPLKLEEIYKICDLMIEQIILRLKEKDINLTVTRAVKTKLSDEGYNSTFGARPLRRLITKHIEDLISNFLLEKKLVNPISINISLDKKTNIIKINI